MKESGYYPPGTEFDPNSPWNASNSKNNEVDVEVCISTTLSKNTTITATNVIVEEWEEREVNDEGSIDRYTGTDYDFSECNFIEDYKGDEFTIPELLNILKQYVLEDKKNGKTFLNILNTPIEYDLNLILKSLSGWVEDELEVIKED